MVNFKYLVLPLLVGVLKTRAAITCTVTKNTNGEYTETNPNDCDDFNGYVLDGSTPKVLVKVTSGTTTSYDAIYNPVPGYYLSKQNTDKAFIKCDADGACTSITSGSPSTCSTEIGMYVSGSGVVIGCKSSNYIYLDFDDDTTPDEKIYVSQYATYGTGGSDGIFNFDNTKSHYVIKRDQYSITYDVKQSEKVLVDVGLDLSDFSLILDRKDDFCETNHDTYYLTCVNGKCNARKKDDYTFESYSLPFITTNKVDPCPELEGAATGSCSYHLKEEKCVIGSTGASPTAIRGYYWNARNEQYNEIIKCNGKKCVKFTPAVTDSCSGKAGQIIDSGYNLLYCKTGSDSPVLLSEFKTEINNDIVDSSKPNYYAISGNSGSPFDNEQAKYVLVDDYTNPTKSLIVDTTYNGKITVLTAEKQCKEGVCHLNECSVTVTPGTANTASTCSLVYCGSDEYDGYRFISKTGSAITSEYESGFLVQLESGSCKVITQFTKPGYYLNQVPDDGSTSLKTDYPLIKCNKTDCRLYSKPDISIYYLNQAEDEKEIIQCEMQSTIITCTAIDPTKEYYLMGKRNLIYCKSKQPTGFEKCIVVEFNPNAYYVINPNADGEYVELVRCDADDCKIYTLEANTYPYHFINGFDNKTVIRCYNKKCKIIIGNNYSNNALYYIDSSIETSNLGLIKCPKDAICQSVTGSPRLAYISQYDNPIIFRFTRRTFTAYTVYEVIVCSSDGCIYRPLDPDDKHYLFLNGGEGNALIECKEDKSTELLKCDDVPGKENVIYLNSNVDTNGENGLILCTKPDTCNEMDVDTSLKYLSYPDGGLLYYDSSDPNSAKWKWEKAFIYRVYSGADEGEKKAYLVNPNTYALLEDNSVPGALVVCTGKEAKYTCVIQPAGSTLPYYFNSRNNLKDDFKLNTVTSFDAGFTAKYNLIEYKNNVLSFIETGIGYYVNSATDVIVCTSSTDCDKYTGLKDAYTNPTDATKHCQGQVGTLVNSGGLKLCYAEGKGPITLPANTKRYIFINMSSKNYMYNVDSRKVLRVKFDTKEDYFYFNKNDATLIETAGNKNGILYICDKTYDTCTEVLPTDIQSGTTYQYYINSDPVTGKIYSTIRCTVVTSGANSSIACESTNVTDKYYCDNNTKLYLCSKKCPTETEKDVPETCNIVKAKKGYYLSEIRNTKLIKCVGDERKCNKSDEQTKEGYYISEDYSKKLIKCKVEIGVLRCNYVDALDGYYIKHDNINTLIKCKDNVCEEVENANGWYVSGNNLLIYCDNSDYVKKCYMKNIPNEGWYVNGNGKSPEGKYLIRCSIKKDTNKNDILSCAESKIINEGYYINAGSKSSDDKLIKRKDLYEWGVTISIENDKYYLNGENNQLIYCMKNCKAVSPTAEFTTWFISAENQLISCNKAKVCTLYKNPSKSGYYLSGDKNKPTKPLIYYDEKNSANEFTLSDDSDIIRTGKDWGFVNKAWFRNGDTNASPSEMVIRCDTPISCSYIEAQSKPCSEIPGGFSIAKGIDNLEWCNTDGVSYKMEFDEEIAMAKLKKSENVLGISATDGLIDQYVAIEISNDEVMNVVLDGYISINGELYECLLKNLGICTKVVNVIDGYYFEHKRQQVHKCRNGICERVIDVSKNIIGENDCKTNLAIYKTSPKICLDLEDEHAKDVGDIILDGIYALNVSGRKFPGAKSDYILSRVSKYFVKYEEEIKMKCVKQGEKNLLDVLDTADSPSKQINSICDMKIDGYEYYDYDTNEGYFIFKEKKLDEVFIPIYDTTKTPKELVNKRHCKIGEQCTVEKIAEVTSKGFLLAEDDVLLEEKINGLVEVVNRVYDGTYYVTQMNQGIIQIIAKIKCIANGDCKRKDLDSKDVDEPDIVDNGKYIQFDIPNVGTIKSSPSVVKYILQKLSNGGNSSKRSVESRESGSIKYGRVLELTHVSYTWSYETRNIFVDDDYVMIADGKSKIKTGYNCYNGDCTEIPLDGNNKYYINTVQLGKKANGYVVCGNGSCVMKDVGDSTLLMANAAARGKSDALILCKPETGCEIIGVSGEAGLPKCKLDVDGVSVFKDRFGVYRKENGEQLLDGQYCLYNGIPWSVDDKKTIENEGIYMFNVAHEAIDYKKVKENNINASLYNCISHNNGSIKCAPTYGYVISESGYSICKKDGCKFMESTDKVECSAGAGTMIIKNQNLEMCTDYSVSQFGGDTDEYHIVTVDVDGNFPEVEMGSEVIVRINKEYKTILVNDGYVLVDPSQKLILKTSSLSTNNILYNCNSTEKTCVEVRKPEKGYYKNSFSNNPIKCDGNACTIDDSGLVEFSINGVELYEYVEIGKFPGYEKVPVIKKITDEMIVALKTDNYILLNTETKKVQENNVYGGTLYTCNSAIGKCAEVATPKDGWYISYKGNGNVIRCESGDCISKDLSRSCSGVGDIVYINNYHLCIQSGKNDNNSLDDNLGKVEKLKITATAKSVFPGGDDYISYGKGYVVGIGKSSGNIESESSPTLYEELILTACQGATKDEQCYSNQKNDLGGENRCCGKTGKYYCTEAVGEGKKCKEQEGLFLLYGNRKIIDYQEIADAVNKRMDGVQMYYCESTGCRYVTGYIIKGNHKIRCDRSGCEIADLTSEVMGTLNNEGKLIIEGNNKVAPLKDKYYYIDGNNEFPGSEGKESILVKSYADSDISYFIIFKGEGYYLVSDESYEFLTDESQGTQGGALYLCNESKMECIKKTKMERGYYLNAAVSGAKGLIKCVDGEGSCILAKIGTTDAVGDVYDTTTNTLNCNESNVGRIVRDAKKTQYSLCYTKNTMEKFTADTTYKFINLAHGNGFLNIDLTDSKLEDSTTILLKITNRSITQVDIDGYILYSSNKSLVESAGSSSVRGQLYLCKEEKYNSNNSSKKTTQCIEIKDVKSGFYFNNNFNDKRYIRCNESQCIVSEAVESKVCLNSGSVIYNNGKMKLCKSKKVEVEVSQFNDIYSIIDTDTCEDGEVININSSTRLCKKNNRIMMNVSQLGDFPGLKINDVNIMVNLNRYEITIIKMQSNVIVNEFDQSMIYNINKEGYSDSGVLYSCINTGVCSKVQYAQNNWYLKYNNNAEANELIYCYKRSCKAYNPVVGFYISSNKQLPIIQCIQPGKMNDNGVVEVKVGENDKLICRERRFVEGWYMNAEWNLIIKDKTQLIKCTVEDGCQREYSERNGWYVNSGADYGYDNLTNIPIYPIIKCSDVCQLYTEVIGKTCTKGGELVGSNGNYELCVNLVEKPAKLQTPKESDNSVQVVKVEEYDDFPYAQGASNILVKISKYEAVQYKKGGYFLKDKTMYKCDYGTYLCELMSNDEYDEMIVYEEQTGTMYKAECSNNACEWHMDKEEGYYFIYEKKESGSIVEGKTVIYNYYDDYNEHEGNPENIVKAVYYCKKNSKGVMGCIDVSDKEGYMYNTRHVDVVSGKQKIELYYYNPPKITVQVVEEVRKCTLSYKDNRCYISYEDEPYVDDILQYDPETDLPINIMPGGICVTRNSKYYFATKDIDTGIDFENCVPIPEVVNIKSADSSVKYLEVDPKRKYVMDKYGIREIDKPKEESNDILCSYDIKTGICKTVVSGNTLSPGEYCKSSTNKLYLALSNISSSNGGNCVRYESDNEDRLPDDELASVVRYGKQYYLVNNELYEIDSEKVTKMDEGVYISDAVNYKIKLNENYPMSISEDSQYKLYVCNKDGCKRKVKCQYEEEFEYIYDGVSESVVKCDPLTNTITRVHNAGYYLNSPWNDIVRCYYDGRCLEINSGNGMEGYYWNKGNENKMITCLRNGEDFKCKEEDLIECSYNKNEGTCKPVKGNLLRNSYCYYKEMDKDVGRVDNLLYVENFVKSGTEGKCVIGREKDLFFKYKKSKFLNHTETDDLIRVSKESIVNIYEKNIGYYVIDTLEGKGVVENVKAIDNEKRKTYERKTRFYVCKKNECKEEIPEEGKIYLNKASDKKLAIFNKKKWEVKDNGCKMNSFNSLICDLSTLKTSVDQFSIIYKDQYDEITLYDNIYSILGKVKLSKHEKLLKSTFVNYRNDLYLLESDGQSFKRQDGGPYILTKPKNPSYQFNLTPYMFTRNETVIDSNPDNRKYLIVNQGDEFLLEGYYRNYADIDNLGIVLQTMKIPQKMNITVDENNVQTSEPEIIEKYKVVINKCKIIQPNICVNTHEKQVISPGSPCVVTEGEFEGIYYATDEIKSTSQKFNCVKYEKYKKYYEYIGSTPVLFTGIYFKNLLIRMKTDRIEPFDHEFKSNNALDPVCEEGYYILDKDNNNFNTTAEVSESNVKAYKCGLDKVENESKMEEIVGCSCKPFTAENDYYYNKANDKIMNYNNKKWKIETGVGYYFLNTDDRTASFIEGDETEQPHEISNEVGRVTGNVVRINYNGRYMNKAAENTKPKDSRPVMVEHDFGSGNENLISGELRNCKVFGDGQCKSIVETNELDSRNACYDGKNLYVVNKIESTEEGVDEKVMCYTGSIDKIKYVLIGGSLYMLDGMSIKNMNSGYYILNENMEAFRSKYPEKPYKIIECKGEDNCSDMSDGLGLNQEVVINEAISNIYDTRIIMRYYTSETGKEKFANVKKDGYYCLDENGEIPGNDITFVNGNCWTVLNGELKKGLIGCSEDDICINSAKLSKLVINGGYSKASTEITVDHKTNIIKYKGESNLDENEIVFKLIDEKLYKLKKDRLEHVKTEGLYIIKKGKPFVENEWNVNGDLLICFYVNKQCNSAELNEYRKHKYVINRAANTIVSYDADMTSWRTVIEDGYYFFFRVTENSEPYSINIEDRRIYNETDTVRRMVDGKLLSNYNNGIFYTEDINDKVYVERIIGEWEDAAEALENVDVISRGKCKGIEINENIEINEYCYSGKKGICMPKTTINDTTDNERNCIFNYNKDYYYLINGMLYIVNGYSYQLVEKDGLYVIDNDYLPYSSSKESEAKAYLCEDGRCEIANDLETMYYLNIAALELGRIEILYYNSKYESWRKVDVNGNYFFNKNGFGVSDGEEIAYYYEVSKNGNEIIDKELKLNTVVQSMSNDKNVFATNVIGKKIAKSLSNCSINSDGIIESDGNLNLGDICINNENDLVIVGKIKTSEKRDEEQNVNVSYEGIVVNAQGKKYIFAEGLKRLVIIDNYSAEIFSNGNGLVILDNDTLLPLESVESVSASVFNCEGIICEKIDNDNLVKDKHYLNSVNEKYPLVKYLGEGKWKVENEVGYYFFDEAVNPVDVNGRTEFVYEVNYEINGTMEQKILDEDDIIGYFVNKSSNKKIMISNNSDYWLAGESLNKCKSAKGEEGLICKTGNDNPEGYSAGQYCHDGSHLYYLIDKITNASETANCVYGTNEVPKYVYIDRNGKINEAAVEKKLIQIDDDAIRVAKNGYYLIDDSTGNLVKELKKLSEREEAKEEIKIVIYKCDEDECDIADVDENEIFRTVDGKIYQMSKDNELSEVSKEGLYFFDSYGSICNSEDKSVNKIIELSEEGGKIEEIDINSFSEGAYINDGNDNFVGMYRNNEWSILEVGCTYDNETEYCTNNNIQLSIGSYCSFESKMYLIVDIDENNNKKCIQGNEEKPLLFNNEENELIKIKEKSVLIVKEEGYYAINDSSLEALDSVEPVRSQLIKCKYDGDCENVIPEIGRYVSHSPEEINIVKYENGNVNETVTYESKCTINGSGDDSVCSAVDGTLNVGDVCVDGNIMYLLENGNGACYKTEKTVDTFQVIDRKLYMLTEEAVIQKLDGYFFINGDNRAITNRDDYSNEDTVGYICSNVGECVMIAPDTVRFFPDYTTMTDSKFSVVKYDPQKKSRRGTRGEGNSGFEKIEEEGIYKLDDGDYVVCEFDDNDEVYCNKFEEEGSYFTRDEELIVCIKSEEGEIECSQAIEGGYYVINGKLMECSTNDDNDRLICKEMDKEGYYISKPGDILYQCVKKVNETEVTTSKEAREGTDGIVGAGDNVESSDDETESVGTELPTSEEEETTTSSVEDYIIDTVEVTCKPVDCVVGKSISQAGSDDSVKASLYVCKNTSGSNNKFESQNCDSGNYVKDRNGYYRCEDDKDDIDEEKIEQPNPDHIAKYKEVKTTTTPKPTPTPTATTTKTTTTKKTSVQPSSQPTSTKASGASSLYRKLPSITFYLVLLIISYYLFI